MNVAEASRVLQCAVIAAGPDLGKVAERYMVETPRGPSIPDATYRDFQVAFVATLAKSSPTPAQSQRVARAFGILAHDPVESAQLWAALAYLVAPFSASFRAAKALRDIPARGRA